jgi:tRNA(Ile)-lysidine synthase TilS/MesJ
VLPEIPPHVVLDAEGICDRCAAARRARPSPRLEPTDLQKELRRHRGRGQHDVLVHCNGGADSVSALLLLVRRYGMRPLVFTPDNGFEQEAAIDNVRRATAILGLDWLHLVDRSIHGLYRAALAPGSGASICTACGLWQAWSVTRAAQAEGIGLVVSGWSPGHLDAVPGDGRELQAATRGTAKLLARLREADPALAKLPATLEEARGAGGLTLLSPHWYHEEEEDWPAVLARELDWRPLVPTYPNPSNRSCCRLSLLSAWLDIDRFGLTFYHVELARLVRRGRMSRSEALAALTRDFDAPGVAAELEALAAAVGGCSPSLPAGP